MQETVSIVTDVISNVGFPIAVAGFMLFVYYKQGRETITLLSSVQKGLDALLRYLETKDSME